MSEELKITMEGANLLGLLVRTIGKLDCGIAIDHVAVHRVRDGWLVEPWKDPIVLTREEILNMECCRRCLPNEIPIAIPEENDSE